MFGNFRAKLPGASEEQIRTANQAVVEDVTRDGRRWISSTLVKGRSVIRMMVISYLTGHRQIEDLIICLTEAAARQRSAARA
ncbi:MAG TPA: hypothetical protein VKL40_14185 [Candidatus Angelobacter sp.]|nr:hypothetical protein [Candidatus Angelobacter sp.]